MKDYVITATLKQDLEIMIKADSYEEALRIADRETISDDWDVVGAVFTLGDATEYKPKKITAEQLDKITAILNENKGE